jgi:hypothetical protein
MSRVPKVSRSDANEVSALDIRVSDVWDWPPAVLDLCARVMLWWRSHTSEASLHAPEHFRLS